MANNFYKNIYILKSVITDLNKKMNSIYLHTTKNDLLIKLEFSNRLMKSFASFFNSLEIFL